MHDFENYKSDLLSRLQGNPLNRENCFVHEVTTIVQTVCSLKVLKVLVKGNIKQNQSCEKKSAIEIL